MKCVIAFTSAVPFANENGAFCCPMNSPMKLFSEITGCLAGSRFLRFPPKADSGNLLVRSRQFANRQRFRVLPAAKLSRKQSLCGPDVSGHSTFLSTYQNVPVTFGREVRSRLGPCVARAPNSEADCLAVCSDNLALVRVNLSPGKEISARLD